MIAGVLGTVISLERAVALSALPGARAWLHAPPLLSGLGALAVLGGLPPSVGRGLIALGSLGLTALFIILRLRPDWAHTTMGVGALLWLAGNLLWWLGWPASRVAPLWAGFLVLTIAGERLELARVLLRRRAALAAFLSANAVLLVGLALSPVAPDVGVRTAGAGLLALGSWLFRFDWPARRSSSAA